MDNPRGNIRLPTLLKRPGTVLLILGVAGALASIYAGRQQALQYQAIEQLRVAELVDNQFSAAQDHIALRENLATVVAALFTPPPVAVANALGEFGAVVLISGNIPFETQVASVHIFSQIESDNATGAAAVSVVLLTLSLLMILSINAIQAWGTRHER